MDELSELLRVLWRRALLLTGDEQSAREVLDETIASFGDVTRVAMIRVGARLAELALGHRASSPSKNWPETVRRVWQRAAGLPPTDFAIWVLSRGEGMAANELALMFDLPHGLVEESLSASDRHVQAAGDGSVEESARALREALTSADSSSAIGEARVTFAAAGRRRRVWSLLKFVVFLVAAGLVCYSLYDLMSSENHRPGAAGHVSR